MTRTLGIGVVSALLVIGQSMQAQTPTLPPEEQRQVDAQMQASAPQLDAKIEVASLKIVNGPIKDALDSLSAMTGLVVKSDQSVPELSTASSVTLGHVTLPQAVQIMLGGTGIAFAPTGAKSIFIYSDTPANRQKFAESVQTFAVTKAVPGAIQQQLMTQPFMRDGIRPVVVTTKSWRGL